jgi:hypothetical protein
MHYSTNPVLQFLLVERGVLAQTFDSAQGKLGGFRAYLTEAIG